MPPRGHVQAPLMSANACHMVTLMQICHAIQPPALYRLVPSANASRSVAYLTHSDPECCSGTALFSPSILLCISLFLMLFGFFPVEIHHFSLFLLVIIWSTEPKRYTSQTIRGKIYFLTLSGGKNYEDRQGSKKFQNSSSGLPNGIGRRDSQTKYCYYGAV